MSTPLIRVCAVNGVNSARGGRLCVRLGPRTASPAPPRAALWRLIGERGELGSLGQLRLGNTGHRDELGRLAVEEPGRHRPVRTGAPAGRSWLAEHGSSTRRAHLRAYRAGGIEPELALRVGERRPLRDRRLTPAPIRACKTAAMIPTSIAVSCSRPSMLGLDKRGHCQCGHEQRQGCVRMSASQQPRANCGSDSRRTCVENAGLAQWQSDVHSSPVDDHDAREHRAGELGDATDKGQPGRPSTAARATPKTAATWITAPHQGRSKVAGKPRPAPGPAPRQAAARVSVADLDQCLVALRVMPQAGDAGDQQAGQRCQPWSAP